jgi:hypothetical protein
MDHPQDHPVAAAGSLFLSIFCALCAITLDQFSEIIRIVAGIGAITAAVFSCRYYWFSALKLKRELKNKRKKPPQDEK